MRPFTALIFTAILFAFCAPLKKAKTSKRLTVGIIKFHKYQLISSEGEKSIYAMADSMAKVAGMDTVNFDPALLVDVYKNSSSESDWIIEFSPDTIWQIIQQKGHPAKKNLIDRKDRTVTLFTNDLVPTVISVNNIFGNDIEEYTQIKEYKNVRKTVLGYNCFKVVYEKKAEKSADSLFNFGNFITEIFVTDKIDLPSYTLLDFPKELPYFPLEIRGYLSILPGVDIIIEAKEISEK